MVFPVMPPKVAALSSVYSSTLSSLRMTGLDASKVLFFFAPSLLVVLMDVDSFSLDYSYQLKMIGSS